MFKRILSNVKRYARQAKDGVYSVLRRATNAVNSFLESIADMQRVIAVRAIQAGTAVGTMAVVSEASAAPAVEVPDIGIDIEAIIDTVGESLGSAVGRAVLVGVAFLVVGLGLRALRKYVRPS